MENSRLFVAVAAMVYLLLLAVFWIYILNKTGWQRKGDMLKFKQKIFYLIWVLTLIFMGILNCVEGLPLVMMFVWGLFSFFAAWFIKEGLFGLARVVHRRKNRRDWHY